jgi:hypothetical protein
MNDTNTDSVEVATKPEIPAEHSITISTTPITFPLLNWSKILKYSTGGYAFSRIAIFRTVGDETTEIVGSPFTGTNIGTSGITEFMEADGNLTAHLYGSNDGVQYALLASKPLEMRQLATAEYVLEITEVPPEAEPRFTFKQGDKGIIRDDDLLKWSVGDYPFSQLRLYVNDTEVSGSPFYAPGAGTLNLSKYQETGKRYEARVYASDGAKKYKYMTGFAW